MAPENFGLIEMGFTSAVVFGFLAWQLWTVRDAGKSPPKDTRHAEREHEADDGRS